MGCLFIQNTNVMHLILFIRQIFSSTCFEYQVLIFRRNSCMRAAYGTVTLYRVLVSCWYAAIGKNYFTNITHFQDEVCNLLGYYAAYSGNVLPRFFIYLVTAIGLSPGGSSTVHIYTQTVHRTTQNKQYIEQQNNLGKYGPCPVLASYTLAFALQLRKKHGKTSVRVAASRIHGQHIDNDKNTYTNNKNT